MTIESRFDVPFIAEMALREKQIQQNFRPIIAVHKWFARRPGTLFRGLILSEFGDRPLAETFFRANDFPGRLVADPFMGGGTPLIEANRVGCDVVGFDINPMSAWIVSEEIEGIDLDAYRRAAGELAVHLEHDIGRYYLTDCPLYGDKDVPVKYFIWVKVLKCERCGNDVDLFPGYLLAENRRHPSSVIVCAHCGELNEQEDVHNLGACRACGVQLVLQGPAKRNHCPCPHCAHMNHYPTPSAGVPRHRMVAIEYHNPHRRRTHAGRFFKKPDEGDLARVAAAAARWCSLEPSYAPTQAIPPGDESDRLHRWGYRHYRDLCNERQLLGLEISCRFVGSISDERVRSALATNISDLLRYQNMLCRYDTMALKSLDVFSVHGFPVGLVQCESNFLGIANGPGVQVGSGGWGNIVEKYIKAKRYCQAPFETKQSNMSKTIVPIRGEWIGRCQNGSRERSLSIRCADSAQVGVEPSTLDGVFTDPPYLGNVQYAELMDFCYVWLRGLVGEHSQGFSQESTRSPGDLTENNTQGLGLSHFAEGLAAVYCRMARALKPGAPLAFTFHHNRLHAYYAVGVAILDAHLVCSATFPCPAEMGSSIHIRGTGSSVVDTVFVCRSHGVVRRSSLFDTMAALVGLVCADLRQLRAAGLNPKPGDIRCIVYGHLTRMAVWNLRHSWDAGIPIERRLELFAEGLAKPGNPETAIKDVCAQPSDGAIVLREVTDHVYESGDAVSF